MWKRKQAEDTNDELCSVAEKEFPLAEMLVDALSQNGMLQVQVILQAVHLSPQMLQACPVRHPVEVIRVVLLRTLCLIGGGINCIVDF